MIKKKKLNKFANLLFVCLLFLLIFKLLICSETLTSKRLFTISKNRNKNIVVYDVQMHNGKIINKNPIKVYWLIYTNNKFVYKDINNLEERAYGVKILTNNNNNLVLILKAVPNRPINIQYTTNGPKAELYINHQKAYISNVYVHTATTKSIIPKVIYYIIKGINVNNGSYIEEKVFL
ncbi:MAG: DUF4833 domain-containing protein [Endomicrobium sp.]|jgi:hypothetical protein|nr:DUF4833 domain-containing protein [Endomicrobium sp.]